MAKGIKVNMKGREFKIRFFFDGLITDFTVWEVRPNPKWWQFKEVYVGGACTLDEDFISAAKLWLSDHLDLEAEAQRIHEKLKSLEDM